VLTSQWVSYRKDTYGGRASDPGRSDSEVTMEFSSKQGRLAYLKIRKIRTIEVPDFSVIDYISTIFRMCPHGSSTVALVVASIDLFGGETEARC
jgi:hypothetical protein